MIGYFHDRVDRFFTKEPMAPVTLNIDPSGRCNQACKWCNMKGGFKPAELTREMIDTLIEQIDGWGVKSACIAGGGEPTMNPDLDYLVTRLTDIGVSCGLITNGLRAIPTAVLDRISWVGFSVDCASRSLYKELKGVDGWDAVMGNIRETVLYRNTGQLPYDVSFKFLITNDNLHELFQSYDMACSLGVDKFHVRPLDKNYLSTPLSVIRTMVENMEKREVVINAIGHRYFQNEQPAVCKNYLTATILSSGKVGICPDQRMRKETLFTDIEHLRKDWGSEKHYWTLAQFPDNCPYCTYTEMFGKIDEGVPFL